MVARGGHPYPAAASARSMHSALSTLEGLPGQVGPASVPQASPLASFGARSRQGLHQLH